MKAVSNQKVLIGADNLVSIVQAVAGKPLAGAVGLLVLTGLPPGKILKLKWEQVDSQAGLLRVRRRRDGNLIDEKPSFSISPACLDSLLLSNGQPRPTERVFPEVDPQWFSQTFLRNACRRARMPWLNVETIRASAVSNSADITARVALAIRGAAVERASGVREISL